MSEDEEDGYGRERRIVVEMEGERERASEFSFLVPTARETFLKLYGQN